jgi:hypothetical protein
LIFSAILQKAMSNYPASQTFLELLVSLWNAVVGLKTKYLP